MTAPARVRVASAPGVTLPRFHGAYKARKKIDTDLEIGDMALIDGSTKVKIINKGNCAASVEFSNGDRTVIILTDYKKSQPRSHPKKASKHKLI